MVAVGDNACTHLFELFKVIDDFAAEESRTVFYGWFIDDHGSTFGLDSFHDTLNAALAEVIGITFSFDLSQLLLASYAPASSSTRSAI